MILLAFLCGTLWVVWLFASFLMYRPRQISGSTVVVTGACSEMGRRLCMQLYARGARVIAWDYSKIQLQELQADVLKATKEAESLDAAGVQGAGRASDLLHSNDFVVMTVDVSSRLQVQRAVKELDGPLDMIVHAAHTCPSKRLSNRVDDSAERLIQTNLLSLFIVVRHLLPLLFPTFNSSSNAGGLLRATQRRGDYAQVVTLVSAAANYTLSSESPEYAASQWGVVGMHYSMREWIAQKRWEYMSGGEGGTPSETKTMAVAGARTLRPAREVRTTLLCLNEIQYGGPTVINSLLSSSSSIPTTVRETSPTSAASPESDGCGSVSPRRWTASTHHEAYTQLMQKRNAELDRAAIYCVNAICRGQERYCYTSAWATAVVYPLLMVCPVPWAIRLLRWMQHTPAAAAEN